MSDVLGFTSLALVSLLSMFVASRYSGIIKIFYVALIIRIFILLIGYYITPLPDSTADAQSFEGGAWDYAREGFFSIFDHYRGPDPYFISFFISASVMRGEAPIIA